MTIPRALAELAALFLRLGVTAFGGPAAHIAMMQHEVVERRRWLTNEQFLDMLAATHLIPGPNSTEMAIHLGLNRGRLPGLVTAGVCFILPASILVGVLAWGYTRYGNTPQVSWLMYGIGPVIIAIITHAVWKLGRTAITGPFQLALGGIVAVLSVAGFHELALLAAGAAVACLAKLTWGATLTALLAVVSTTSAAVTTVPMVAAQATVPVTLIRLTLVFLKVGSILFGSGYVLLAFLRADLVERWAWLTERQLIDAITVGQAQPLLPRLRTSTLASGLLDGVVLASLGLMAAVTWELGPATIVDVPTAAIALVCLGALIRWSPNATWLIAGGAILGWLLRGG